MIYSLGLWDATCTFTMDWFLSNEQKSCFHTSSCEKRSPCCQQPYTCPANCNQAVFLWLCLNLFYVFVFLCKPALAFSLLNPSKRTYINTRMCSPVQFIYNVFHFSHASSLFSYYFSKFRPNYTIIILVGCPMFMMGLASTSLLSEGSRRSFGMFCCLSVWGQIHERQTARGCVRFFCLGKFLYLYL